MKNRAVVNVATGAHYIKGQERLTEALAELDEDYMVWRDTLPPDSPTHQNVPYAFKAFALEAARKKGHTLLMWADASIVPIAKLDPIWEYAEAHGVWLADNGWRNSQWTCDLAYPELFSYLDYTVIHNLTDVEDEVLECLKKMNRTIKHVVATAFALDLAHPKGVQFFLEYLRLAKTKAFCGPWWNSNGERPEYAKRGGAAPCGPPECLGHRHDQTAASVIAWRLGLPLTECPRFFAYEGERSDETILVARGI
jgi:hypothetical protein